MKIQVIKNGVVGSFWVVMILLVMSATGLKAVDQEKVEQVRQGQLQTARVSWWGYNQEDCTAFLQSAFHSQADTIIIDKMAAPWITNPLIVPSNKKIILEEGAELLAKKGSFHGLGDSLLVLSKVKNVVIRGEGKGAVLRMRKADYHTDAYQKSEWRHGIQIKSSENIVIENISIISSGGDGIYLGCAQKGVTNTNVRISHVICDDNNRQGISVITAENLLIENTVMKNTFGTAPESGIDFEPNDKSEKLVNCVMKNCLCENNAGDAYQFYLPNLERSSGPASIVLDHCVSKNNKRNGLFLVVGNSETKTLEGSFTVTNCKFENDGSMVKIVGKSVDGMALTVENTELWAKDVVSPQKDKSPIDIYVNMADRMGQEPPIGNMNFKNVTVHYQGNKPVINFHDDSFYANGLADVHGDITWIKNGKKTVTVLDDQWCQKNYPKINNRRIPIITPKQCKTIPFGVNVGSNSQVILRHKTDYSLVLTKGEKVSLVWEQRSVGRSVSSKKPLILTAPSGKTSQFPIHGEFRKANRIEFIPEETGIYTLSASTLAHGSLLKESSVPMNFCLDPYCNFVYTQGTCYFYVPKGTKEFAIQFFGESEEKAKVTVFDPDGKQYWQKDNVGDSVICYSEEGKIPGAGVWTIKTERPSSGVLEDFHIALFGVPPYLFCSPKIITVNRE